MSNFSFLLLLDTLKSKTPQGHTGSQQSNQKQYNPDEHTQLYL